MAWMLLLAPTGQAAEAALLAVLPLDVTAVKGAYKAAVEASTATAKEEAA